MAYLGNTPTTQSFIEGTDYFNGDGSTTAFTLSRTVVSPNDVMAVVNNVVQQPNSAYTISGTTITFTSAPSSGTSNIYVRYLSTTTQSITPSQNTVSYSTWNSDLQNKTWGFKNRLINSNMVIDQRNAGASVTGNDGVFSVDRWVSYVSASSKFTMQQSSTAPAGFKNSVVITSSASTSLGSGDYYVFQQTIEGYNVADLAWGTVNAKTVTLSFWVYSSLTGTFSGSIKNTATGATRSYPFTYAIGAANTWTQVSVTIPGDQSGTWGTTNSNGLCVCFSLGTGTTYSGTAGAWAGANYLAATGAGSVVGTSGATWYLTGVQLEVGTQATNFDVRDYGRELQMCQRYYWQMVNGDQNNIGSGVYYSTTTFICSVQFPVTMRAAPTLSYVTGTAYYVIYGNNTSDTIDGFYLGATSPITTNVESGGQGASGTAGYGGQMRSNNASAKTAFTAEL